MGTSSPAKTSSAASYSARKGGGTLPSPCSTSIGGAQGALRQGQGRDPHRAPFQPEPAGERPQERGRTPIQASSAQAGRGAGIERQLQGGSLPTTPRRCV